MDKYEKLFLKYESRPKKINKFLLDRLLARIKREFSTNNEYITGKEENSFYLLLLSDLLTHSGEKEVQYINSHYLHRIRKNYLYGLFIQTICNNLLRGDEEHLNIFLDSFIKSGLADDTRVIASDKQDVFLLTLPDGRKIKFSNVPLPKDLIDEYRGNCHAVISSWMRLYKKDHNVSVVFCSRKWRYNRS